MEVGGLDQTRRLASSRRLCASARLASPDTPETDLLARQTPFLPPESHSINGNTGQAQSRIGVIEMISNRPERAEKRNAKILAEGDRHGSSGVAHVWLSSKWGTAAWRMTMRQSPDSELQPVTPQPPWKTKRSWKLTSSLSRAGVAGNCLRRVPADEIIGRWPAAGQGRFLLGHAGGTDRSLDPACHTPASSLVIMTLTPPSRFFQASEGLPCSNSKHLPKQRTETQSAEYGDTAVQSRLTSAGDWEQLACAARGALLLALTGRLHTCISISGRW
jgi:hypothetical protein